MNNWFKVNRKILSSDLWLSETFTRGQAWVDLVGLANHNNGFINVRGNVIVVKRGQVGWSEVKLARRWKWSRNKLRRYLKWLKAEQQVEQQNNSVSSIITILNYNIYQGSGTADDTADGTADDTADGTLTRRNKKKENEKEINTYAQEFEKFWLQYPRKIGKSKASKIYEKIGSNHEGIMQGLVKATAYWKKQGTELQYIPHPSTWLNGERWNDEQDSEKQQLITNRLTLAE